MKPKEIHFDESENQSALAGGKGIQHGAENGPFPGVALGVAERKSLNTCAGGCAGSCRRFFRRFFRSSMVLPFVLTLVFPLVLTLVFPLVYNKRLIKKINPSVVCRATRNKGDVWCLKVRAVDWLVDCLFWRVALN
jgi:hypothetical protein